MDAPIIFLDFDGVMRRNASPEGRLEPALLSHLERLFARFSRLRGVFSTNWRVYKSLTELSDHLPATLRPRFIDVTPEVTYAGIASRYSEILAWRRAVGHTGSWVAIDDRPAEFPDRCPQLCICDAARGFDAEAEARCTQQLIELVTADRRNRSQ